MIKASSADYICITIKKSNHSALQADGVTPLNIVGECHFTLSRDGIELQLEALVVNDLDVDILAGIPFMSYNDIAIFPSKHKIVIRDKVTVIYGSPNEELNSSNTRVQLDCILAIDPHTDASRTKDWPSSKIAQSVAGKIRIVNNTLVPQFIQQNEHFCRVRLTTTIDNAPEAPDNIRDLKTTNYIDTTYTSHFFKQVSVDPDNLLSPDLQTQFNEFLQKFSEIFSPNFEGYNGAIGPFESSVNMVPVQPPQRKGRMPQYSKNNLVELQNKFDELESKGVFRKPEDVGISVEYINPSFLVKKASSGFRLVTAFADVGRYSKPKPSLMPDVDSTLRTIAQWKYIIKSDLTSAFYQIPLAKDSMKYCGVTTPYHGVRGSISASTHRHDRVATLASCPVPDTVRGLRSFIGAYKMLSRVIPNCSNLIAPLEEKISGMKSADKIIWSDMLREHFEFAQKSLSSHKAITLPKCSDQLWIVTDGSVTKSGIRATLYINRDGNQLRASSYKVKLSECYKVLNTISVHRNPRYSQNVYNEESDCDDHNEDSLAGSIRDLPPARAEPPPILICENIDDVENLDEPTGQPDNSLERDLTNSKSSNEQDNKHVLRKRSELKTPAWFKDFIAF
ncbi:unnamed protein product [Mytilus coruscus]|uniref:Reverse transcriptase/retrotransposon-derived protein RNase H-like domain-containing protein n=1 Tax=Mytilus coruscus TaxID=42192 RepID=A0A6J8AP58_MYTCO|nr:unnamed protein product [Mytilus coruscus]